MKTVVFLDLDGTLWERGKVPDSAREAIRIAQERGHKVLSNTGRSRSEVSDLTYLGLDGYCFASGAEVIVDGKTLVDKPLGAENVLTISAVFDEAGLNYNLEGGDQSWRKVNDQAAYQALIAMEVTEDPIMTVPPVEDMPEDAYGHIHKLFYHGGMRGAAVYDQLAARMPEGIVLTDLGHGFAEATAASVDKGGAMEAVRTYLGSDWRTMAVGDSDNDLAMLRAADISVCMGNGNENAKAVATWVTTDIHEDGLLNAFRHFGLA